VDELSLEDREEAINWIIENQLGRRNLTTEQKSYLRGKRYIQEKTTGHGKAADQDDPQETAERLGRHYGVGPATVKRDAAFAEAVDVLDEEVRQDIRETILKHQRNGTQKVTKKQVTKAGKAVQTKKVQPLPFMDLREGAQRD
jgi:hypothetical protein